MAQPFIPRIEELESKARKVIDQFDLKNWDSISPGEQDDFAGKIVWQGPFADGQALFSVVTPRQGMNSPGTRGPVFKPGEDGKLTISPELKEFITDLVKAQEICDSLNEE